jgi:hypothetical protein
MAFGSREPCCDDDEVLLLLVVLERSAGEEDEPDEEEVEEVEAAGCGGGHDAPNTVRVTCWISNAGEKPQNWCAPIGSISRMLRVSFQIPLNCCTPRGEKN